MFSPNFFCVCLFAVFFFGTNAFAGKSELTTYYPTPYGEYGSLQAKRLSVGDANGDGQLSSADQANQDGHLRLKPQDGYPQNWDAGQTGEFAYSSKKNALYHYNGSAWVE